MKERTGHWSWATEFPAPTRTAKEGSTARDSWYAHRFALLWSRYWKLWYALSSRSLPDLNRGKLWAHPSFNQMAFFNHHSLINGSLHVLLSGQRPLAPLGCSQVHVIIESWTSVTYSCDNVTNCSCNIHSWCGRRCSWSLTCCETCPSKSGSPSMAAAANFSSHQCKRKDLWLACQ